MVDTRTHRRLAAILAADVAGYSRLIGVDEEGTLAALQAIWADCFNPMVAQYNGRIVKMLGDGALVEFASAVDAVECAVAIQSAMTMRQARAEPIELRIGVNLGDIVILADDIFGDGVNIAARLESHAPRNGVLLSDAVHAQIKGRVSVTFLDAGELALKNIAAPVRAWHWGGDIRAPAQTPPPTAPAQNLAVAPPAPVPQASIAVLPFTNMSGDPEQEYFSDGISDDIITDLSKISGLLVVARNSSFAYKGKSPDIRAVGRELGVASVLEGSIRRSGNRIRITAQLIDTTNGGHLWAERYDRDLTDIFAVQDEVTLKIVAALQVTLRPAEKALLGGARTSNVAAHDSFLRGRELLLSPNKNREVFHQVIAALTQAITLDSSYAEPYAGLGLAYMLDFQNKWVNTPNALELSSQYFAQAIARDPNEPYAHYAAAIVSLFKRDLDLAEAQTARALALNPNYALAYGTRGTIEIFLGRPLQAMPYLHRAIRLDPVNTHQFLHFLGLAFLVAGDYQTAAETFRERIRLAPNTDMSRCYLIAALGHLGLHDEAQIMWFEIVAINPTFSFQENLARLPFRDGTDLARIAEGLMLAHLTR